MYKRGQVGDLDLRESEYSVRSTVPENYGIFFFSLIFDSGIEGYVT